MSDMKEQCVYFCGPYKDYCGRAEYDHEADVFHGDVVGTQDVVTFQGKAPAELRQAFRDSVDDYLEFCSEIGKSPDKPFSGKFVARLDPSLHKKLSMMAQAAGKSLNQFLCDSLEAMANTAMSESVLSGPIMTAESPKRKPSQKARRTAKRVAKKVRLGKAPIRRWRAGETPAPR